MSSNKACPLDLDKMTISTVLNKYILFGLVSVGILLLVFMLVLIIGNVKS